MQPRRVSAPPCSLYRTYMRAEEKWWLEARKPWAQRRVQTDNGEKGE